MTPEERVEMNRLVTLIQQEKDASKFTRLVEQLNQLMVRKEVRLKEVEKREPDS